MKMLKYIRWATCKGLANIIAVPMLILDVSGLGLLYVVDYLDRKGNLK